MSGTANRRFAVAAQDSDWFAAHPDRFFRTRVALQDELASLSWPWGVGVPTGSHGYAVIRFSPRNKLLFLVDRPYEQEPNEEQAEQMFLTCQAATEEAHEW